MSKNLPHIYISNQKNIMKKIFTLSLISFSALYAQNGGFDCINSDPAAYELFQICSNGDAEACLQFENYDCLDANDWNPSGDSVITPGSGDPGVFIICNGETIDINTSNFNEESFINYVESLNCEEAEDWLSFDNLTNQYFDSENWSWDCIYNYPEAAALYSDWSNPEGADQLADYCQGIADGYWAWGNDPSAWPISCEDGSSIATVSFETSGIGWEDEISWELTGYEGGIGLTPVCINDGCLQFNMFDSWGDGWQGVTYTIHSPSGILSTGTLESGYTGSIGFGLNTNEDCTDLTQLPEVNSENEVSILCNGEIISIDTTNLTPGELDLILSTLNCYEWTEDWDNIEDSIVNPEPSNYFSWDCINNYPEASALYNDWSNPEAADQLADYCQGIANGDWAWGNDPNAWPISCEEGTSIATVSFESTGSGWEEEISWELTGYEGGVGLTPVCINDGCLQFNMFDSWGDGWQGVTYTIHSPSGILSTGTLESGFTGSIGFGLNTSEDCSEVIDIENPNSFTSFEEVFPGIGEIDFNVMFPDLEMTNEDLFFIIEASDFDISVLDQFGISYVPEEIDGYLIFGPLSIDDILTFLIDFNIIGDLELGWGFFRPMSDEILSQGTFSKDDSLLPSLFSLQFLDINENTNRDLEIFNTYYIDLLGRRMDKIPDSGFAIKILQTNQGVLSEKVYYKN